MKNQLNKNIYIADYYVLYLGSLYENRQHGHYAMQVTISLNKPFIINTKQVKQTVSGAVMIDSNMEHYIECDPDACQLIILLEPESEEGNSFQQLLHKKNGIIITKINRQKLINLLQTSYPSATVFELVMTEMGFKSTKVKDDLLDERIKKVLDLIQDIYNSDIRVKEIADLVFLSESRFQHLFKEQMSIPFSKYWIWFKMKQAVKLILEGKKSYSYAALESGFTDYPYMCRTFKHFFGFRPNQLLKKQQDISRMPSF